MLPSLSGSVHRPASGQKPRQLVILLHGLGADGNDLIGLAPYWAPLLRLTVKRRSQRSRRRVVRERGDVVVRRRDGAFAYQLAVVVDDARQAVSDVVRGADLLDNTPWQMALQRALGLPTPRYTHLPLVLEREGGKLSKSRRSLALDARNTGVQLYQALTLLQQAPPPKLKLEPPPVILAWATAHWSVDRFRGVKQALPQE
jgi:hypothetical protein